MSIQYADEKWAQGRIADTASEIFRTLTKKRSPNEAADILTEAISRSLFESHLIRGKLIGAIPSDTSVQGALLNLDVHKSISEAILDSELQSIQRIHSKFIWTGWISRRRKPL